MGGVSEVKFPVPEQFRRGRQRKDERASVDRAHALLEFVDGCAALAGARILDFGCGVKLVQALLEKEYRHRRYVGVDVYREMIEYLRAHVTDPRFAFAALDFHNEMYNKQGERMTGASRLPIADEAFDILTMFSVISHMNPADTLATLTMLRSYAAPGATLVFTAFAVPGQAEEFVDKVPEKALLNAYYRKEFLDALVGKAGWRIERFIPGGEHGKQSRYVCRPDGPRAGGAPAAV